MCVRTDTHHSSIYLSVYLFAEFYTFLNSCLDHQNKNIILGLSVALLLCSGRESCFHFVNSGGMEELAHVFSHGMQNSSAIILLLLGVIEQATRYPIGCEGILGWWPREDENVPSGVSKGYSQLLKLFLKRPQHDVASLATYVLHRLRFYEVASRYEVHFQFVYLCVSICFPNYIDVNMW